MDTKGIMVYDLVQIPECLSIDDIIEITKKTNFLFYDSTPTSKINPSGKPHMINPEEPMEKILIDVSTEEGKKIYEEITLKLKTDGI